MRQGKGYKKTKELVDSDKKYKLEEAVDLLKKCGNCKFDETVEVTINLSVDPKQTAQQVRGTVILPHGSGKTKKVYVIAKGEKVKEAEAGGADKVGFEDIIGEISKGVIGFDVLVTTPDCMRDLGKVGRILGPRGLMPSPKSGTVTMDLSDAVKKIKAGQQSFKIDSYGILHLGVGKVSFEKEKIIENVTAFIDSVKKLRPSSVKGQYMENIFLSSTMGPGIKLDTSHDF